jgi:hypothetical protein
MDFTELLGQSLIRMIVYGVIAALVGLVIYFFLFDRR